MLLAICLGCLQTAAQTVYVELGGASTAAGVHYDSRFSSHTRWGGRIGVAYTHSKDADFFQDSPYKTTGWTFPAAVNYLIGGRQHYLELGIGVSYGLYQTFTMSLDGHQVERHRTGTFGFLDIGYRFQSKHGWMLRAGLNPGLGLGMTDELGNNEHEANRATALYPYVSVGYSF